MRLGKNRFLIPFMLSILIVAGIGLLWPASNASAQCGSQASSCKNCHEVQGQDPVNNDGTGWHQSHAFGDFCYLCHAGNNQSIDIDAAHADMVPPLSDVKAGCQSCHPNDLMERAQVYAAALGVEVGTGGGAATNASPPGGGSETSSSANAAAAVEAPAMVVESAEIIDYNQIYTGKRPINWGNVILSIFIGLITVGGGGYVYWNERKLRGLPLLARDKPRKVEEKPGTTVPVHLENYSPEVLALLPSIAQLNPVGMHALKRILENPQEASELLQSLSRLDPELVRRIRSLDRDSRALLLALSGD